MSLLPFSFLFFSTKFVFPFSFLFFASVDTGVRDSKPIIPEGVVRSVQITDLQKKQKAASFPVSTGGDTVIGDVPGVAALDLDSRLFSF